MNVLRIGFSLLAAAAVSASAQVAIEVSLPQEQFLPGEALSVAVKISNRSGETLHFGKTSEWLKILIEGEGGYTLEKSDELPDSAPFSLDSSRSAKVRLNLTPHLRSAKPGRYKLRAEVRVAGWNEPLVSPPKSFDIITGTKLWDQAFGVPKTGNPPEVRRYLLQQANYLKHLELFVRVVDLEEESFVRVLPLGPLVSFGHPTASVDKESLLHVLFQTSARGYKYCVVSPEGDLRVRQNYVIEESRPRLYVDDTGKVSVKGASRQKSADDLPVELDPLPARPIAPPPTNAPAAPRS